MKFKRLIISTLMLLVIVACGSAPASQHDMDITTSDANTGVTFRAAVNAALQALASTSTGATAPATTYPNQFWADTTAGMLKIRNSANTAWINFMPLGTSLTATVADLNNAASVTSTVTSAVQTQLDAKVPASVAGPTATATIGYSGGIVLHNKYNDNSYESTLDVDPDFISINAPVITMAAQYDLNMSGATVSLSGVPTYASNSAALSGGLTAGRIYRTSTGQLMIVY